MATAACPWSGHLGDPSREDRDGIGIHSPSGSSLPPPQDVRCILPVRSVLPPGRAVTPARGTGGSLPGTLGAPPVPRFCPAAGTRLSPGWWGRGELGLLPKPPSASSRPWAGRASPKVGRMGGIGVSGAGLPALPSLCAGCTGQLAEVMQGLAEEPIPSSCAPQAGGFPIGTAGSRAVNVGVPINACPGGCRG